MKNTLKLMLFVLMAFALFACGEKKITQQDLKEAEATLFNEDQTINEAVAPQVAEKYCQFVKQNPDDPTAAQWLYHALEINFVLNNTDKSIEVANQLVKQYPQTRWAPMSLLMLGTIYNDQLNDTAQAHVAFQKVIDDYPESELVNDAKKSIEYLGLTPDEIITLMMMSQLQEEEAEL